MLNKFRGYGVRWRTTVSMQADQYDGDCVVHKPICTGVRTLIYMTWEDQTISSLKDEEIDVIAYIPDTALSDLVTAIECDNAFNAVPVAREEEAVGVLSGAWLGGHRGALICQSSGLANTFNALGSLSKAVRIPFLGIVTHRGGLGDHNLAHRPAEYPMPDLLDTIGIRNYQLHDTTDVERRISMAAQSAYSMEEPFILLLERTLTAEGGQ